MGVCALQRGLYHIAESVRMGVKEERGRFAYDHGANFENDMVLGHSDREPKEALPSFDRQQTDKALPPAASASCRCRTYAAGFPRAFLIT